MVRATKASVKTVAEPPCDAPPAEPPVPCDAASPAQPPAPCDEPAKEASTKGKAKPAKTIAKKERAKSAYTYFAAEWRKDNASATPGSLGDTSKRCAAAWKEVEDKSKYEAMAREDKARRVAAAPPKPKRAASAFLRFCSAERPKLKASEPELDFKGLSQRLGAAWKALTDEERGAWKVDADAEPPQA